MATLEILETLKTPWVRWYFWNSPWNTLDSIWPLKFQKSTKFKGSCSMFFCGAHALEDSLYYEYFVRFFKRCKRFVQNLLVISISLYFILIPSCIDFWTITFNQTLYFGPHGLPRRSLVISPVRGPLDHPCRWSFGLCVVLYSVKYLKRPFISVFLY